MTARKYLALTLFLMCSMVVCVTRGQTIQPKSDSLNIAFQKAVTDSQKVNILLEQVAITPCSDVANKLKYANAAKQLANKNGWAQGQIRANRSLAGIYMKCLNDYANGIACYEQIATLSKEANDTVSEALSLEAIAKCYAQQANQKKAIEYYNRILDLKPGFDTQMGVLADMGVTYSDVGDYPNALSCYLRSLAMLQGKKSLDGQDTIQKAGILINVGNIYLLMSQPDKAFSNYEEVLVISTQVKDDNLEIWGLMGMGTAYEGEGKYDKATEALENALKKSATANDAEDEVKILNELAATQLKADEEDKAMKYAQQALALAIEKKYSDPLPVAYSTIGNIYLKKSEYDNAVVNLKKALDLYHETGALDFEKDLWESLSNTYNKMDQPAKALDAYKQFINIRDSLHNVAKANEMVRMDLQFDFNKRQLADSLKQAAVYSKKIERQRVLTYSGLAVLALVLLLTFFIYRSYAVQRKYNELLSKEQKGHIAHIEQQSNALEDIAHIQSHQVRGPVATILGLLEIYNHEEANDPLNKEVITGISETTQKLDKVVKEVVYIENKLRFEQKGRSAGEQP